VHNNPVILIAVFLAILGINFIVMGLLAELIVRTYHESQGKPIYHIRETKNFDRPDEGVLQAKHEPVKTPVAET
jgi:hypothetical protein